MILYIKENTEDEVRYIDTTLSQGYDDIVRKKDWKQVYNQEPIKNNETIRVYHGCDLQTAVQIAIEGVSGKEWHPRKYSYEAGMNPVGLFVSTSFQVVKKFSNPFNGGKEKNASVIIEFSAKASDLDTPVWNNSSSYFGQGSNPMPFKDKEERDKQKELYQSDALKSKYNYIKSSDNPAMAERIFDNSEHQALFIGDLSPNMIKRFWVQPMKRKDYYWVEANKEYIPMKRSEFLKEYGNQEFYINGTNNEYKKIKNTKLYLPNEDYDGIEGFAKRMEDKWAEGNKYIEKEKREGKYDYEARIKDKAERIEDFLKWNDYDCLKDFLWPKQLIQLLGKEKYEEVFDRFGIGTKNESKQIKKIYIKEEKLHLLKEGYYGKHFEKEAENIANQIIQGIKNKEAHLEFNFNLDNEHVIKVNWERTSKKCGYTRVRRGMRGKCFVRCIDIYGDENVTLNEYKEMLVHEFTHAYDTYNGFTNDADIQSDLSDSYLIPWEIREVIYHLWMPSEFNAWQSTYDLFNKDFNDYFEENMNHIQKAYEMPTEGQFGKYLTDTYDIIWEKIRKVVISRTPQKYKKCNLNTFKKFFIKKSLNLLNKFVKKWNGKQHVYENLLKENASSVLYHFTKIDNLINILETNSFILSDKEQNDNFPKGYKYWFSTTRQKNGSIGHSADEYFDVRITLNGDKFNSSNQIKGKPYNYYDDYHKDHEGMSLKQELINQDDNFDEYGNFNVQWPNQCIESEDRIFSKNKIIDDALNYIERIDVYALCCDIDEELLNIIFEKNLNDIVYIYPKEKDYILQNKKCIHPNQLDNYDYEGEFQNLIKENASSVLYHFTDFDTFKKIAETDDFILSKTDEYNSANNDVDSNTVNNEINGKYPYYISFTRSPNANQGFSQWYMPNSNMSNFKEDDYSYKGIVRIEFDGDKLNQHFKSHPIDFFTHKFQTMTKKDKENHEMLDKIKFPNNTDKTSSKEVQLTTPNQSINNKSVKSNPNPFFVQNEDRLFSNEEIIPNISRFITRVDIKIYDKYKQDYYQDVFNIVYKTILGKEGKIHLYDTFNGLNRLKKGKNLRINGDIEGNSTAFKTIGEGKAKKQPTFKEQCIKISENIANECDEFLSSLKTIPYYNIFIDEDYDIDDFDYDGNALGMFEDGMSYENNEIWIALNFTLIEKNLQEYIEEYGYSLEEILETTIYHEVGHGILRVYQDYIQKVEEYHDIYEENVSWMKDIFRDENEEDIVEEFAWSWYEGSNNSRLHMVIKTFEESEIIF